MKIVLFAFLFLSFMKTYADEFPKSEPVYTKLVSGVNHQLLNDVLGKRLSVDYTDNEGSTALIHASSLGDIAKVKSLVKLGADVNARKSNGATALIAAAQTGREKIVSYLIQNGADTELTATITGQKQDTSFEATALYQAVSFNYPKTSRALLDEGANPNPDIDFSPLYKAYINRNQDLFQTLLDYGANPNGMVPTQDGSELRIRELASIEKEAFYAQALEASGASRTAGSMGYSQNKELTLAQRSELDQIARFGDIDKMKQKLLSDMNLNLASSRDGSMRLVSEMLITNIQSNGAKPEFVSLLLEYGADANAEAILITSETMTPMLANINFIGHLEDKAGLDKLYSQLDATTKKYMPYRYVPRADRLKILHILLEHGSSIDDPRLIKSAYSNDMSVAKVLIEYGADPNPTLESGLTVLESLTEELSQTETAKSKY